MHPWRVVEGRLRLAGPAGVLASVGRDQAIDRVVDVLVARRNDVVPEIDRFLRVVANRRDVADRIEGVVRSWSRS